jgi:hypothetical protein
VNPRNRRKAGRVPVGIPVKLHTRAGAYEADIVDLSRTGLRLQMPAGGRNEDVHAAAERLGEALSPSFDLDLHHKRLGPLLKKAAFAVRVGLPAEAPGVVEVCCEFSEELRDDEIGYLDLTEALPEVDESVEEWVEIEQPPAPAPADPIAAQPLRPRQRYRVLIAGMKRNAPPSLFCHTDLVTAIGVRVRLERAEVGVKSSADASVSQTLVTLISRYGDELELRILDESGDVWSGPARFSGVELPRADPEVVLVTLGFERNPSLAELRKLGLLASVA